jgi:hypothetical protein
MSIFFFMSGGVEEPPPPPPPPPPLSALSKITGYLYDANGSVITVGKLRITPQQDFISLDGTKIVPFPKEVDLSDEEGLIDIDLHATVGATPDGLAYFVEFDPDPADTSIPMKLKDGYFSNYWTVPPSALPIPIGNFTTALRGAPMANYMPLNGVVNTGTNAVYIGPETDVTKRLIANVPTQKGEIRYNASTNKWEFSHDGTTFYTIAAEEAIESGQDTFLLGTNGNTTKKIVANQTGTNKPEIRYNATNGKWEFSHDGVTFFIPSGQLTIPTADLLNDWLYFLGGL